VPVAQDAGVLWALLRGARRGDTHAERLERFYGPQADHYDRFRERLLHGRRDLIERLPVPDGGHVVELGGGTGRNLEFFGPRIDTFGGVDLVDLCRSLLAKARERCARWPNVRLHEGDASTWRPSAPVDAVYFSYALTMVPDWPAAIDNALSMLAAGGVVGVVDFHVPVGGGGLSALVNRRFWPRWFAHDGVHLSDAHLPRLLERCRPLLIEQRTAAVPYLPGLRVPYYVFVGEPR
jgi:S-adenosylmethionine-diacylgycerolhomoserine-N-methlytransferase